MENYLYLVIGFDAFDGTILTKDYFRTEHGAEAFRQSDSAPKERKIDYYRDGYEYGVFYENLYVTTLTHPVEYKIEKLHYIGDPEWWNLRYARGVVTSVEEEDFEIV